MTVRVIESEVGVEQNDSAEWRIVNLTFGNSKRCWTVNDNNLCWDKVSFDLTIERKGGFYWYTIVLPSLIITFLAFLGYRFQAA